MFEYVKPVDSHLANLHSDLQQTQAEPFENREGWGSLL